MSKPIQLKPDYSDKPGYGINAYSAEDERGRGKRKEAFLTDARALLKAATAEFKKEGWVSKHINNRGGVAVSGESYCYLSHPSYPKMLFIEVSGTSMSMGRHSDGALIMVQFRMNNGRNTMVDHHNIYLSANLNSEELAFELRPLLNKCKS